ncbi:hypothetical protein OH77DRAFT_1126491 [Trametes cingulata]|nr:hypothetical protein OH77DRAFT_1126491 [Trametes cingulata]
MHPHRWKGGAPCRSYQSLQLLLLARRLGETQCCWCYLRWRARGAAGVPACLHNLTVPQVLPGKKPRLASPRARVRPALSFSWTVGGASGRAGEVASREIRVSSVDVRQGARGAIAQSLFPRGRGLPARVGRVHAQVPAQGVRDPGRFAIAAVDAQRERKLSWVFALSGS